MAVEKNIENIAGYGSNIIEKISTKIGDFISNTTLIEWVLILIVVIGGYTIYYLVNKYNLNIRLWKKKPKKTFN